AWIRSVQLGVADGPSAWDGFASMLVADACIASARSGQPVDVAMPEMADIYRRA
ncbi:MAG: inositol 2-dehydrogenase, partial [Caldilineaceae bacterium]|nr:inositol 2-dehydrogenase [Caldilineaceae bacterium]